MTDVRPLPMDPEPETTAPIGVIGGYGISEDIDIHHKLNIETPYGTPSHPVIVGRFGGGTVAFLSRHGEGRNIPSHQVNYRANLFALYRLGVRRIVSATANGSLHSDIEPGDIAIPIDYIDETKTRKDTFFDGPPPRHFSSYEPFCPEIRSSLADNADILGFDTHDETTLVIIEGPRFATAAESKMYRQAGADIIGGSTYPEMALARELEMCYANFALVTDYDNGVLIDGVDAAPVTLQRIDEELAKYGDECTPIIEGVVAEIRDERCRSCTGHAEKARSDNHPEWEFRE